MKTKFEKEGKHLCKIKPVNIDFQQVDLCKMEAG